MGDSEASRQAEYLAPPTFGGVLRLQSTVTAQALDLTSMAGWPGNQVSGGDGAGPSSNSVNPIGHYVTIMADNGSVWVQFADSYTNATMLDASVSTTAVDGSGTAAAKFTPQGAQVIPAGIPMHFKIPTGTHPQTTPYGKNSKCRFMGFITNNANVNVNFTIYQSCP